MNIDDNDENENNKPKETRSNRSPARGFGSMDIEKQREIARKGGKAAHAQGTAHRFTSDEARAAGKKGGAAVSANRDHMAEIGRKGGEARGAQRRADSEHPPASHTTHDSNKNSGEGRSL